MQWQHVGIQVSGCVCVMQESVGLLNICVPGGGAAGPPLAAIASQACARSGGTSWYTCCSRPSCTHKSTGREPHRLGKQGVGLGSLQLEVKQGHQDIARKVSVTERRMVWACVACCQVVLQQPVTAEFRPVSDSDANLSAPPSPARPVLTLSSVALLISLHTATRTAGRGCTCCT